MLIHGVILIQDSFNFGGFLFCPFVFSTDVFGLSL